MVMLQLISKNTTKTQKEGHGLESYGKWRGQQGPAMAPDTRVHQNHKVTRAHFRGEEEAECCYWYLR